MIDIVNGSDDMIYVITHKDFENEFLDKKVYRILHVGENSTKEALLRDDTGDNISNKNKSFCELTGLYWIWKNAEEVSTDIIGLVHYRRFFTTHLEDILYTYFGVQPKLIDVEKLHKALLKYDVILPKRETIHRTVKQYYADNHVSDDLEITRMVIAQMTPEYLSAYDTVMEGHNFYYGNMIVCQKETLDAYCKWLFPILFEVEKRNNLDKYENDYQKRVYGFLSERLIQVWLLKNKRKIKEYPAFNTESRRLTFFQKNLSRVTKLLGRKK